MIKAWWKVAWQKAGKTRKSLDNNDRDQVESAIQKTSCGLAHYYVPQYGTQRNRFAPRVLQSCDVSEDSKRWVYWRKKRNVFPDPSMTLLLWFFNLYLLQSLYIWQIESEPSSGRCYTNNNDLNWPGLRIKDLSHQNIWETHHLFLLTWRLLVKI